MVDINAALEALADPIRRELFERIVVRPLRVGEVAEGMPVTRPAVSYHVRKLKDAQLIEAVAGKLRVKAETLPQIRVYFDHLWLEAVCGDAWLAERRNRNLDLGL